MIGAGHGQSAQLAIQPPVAVAVHCICKRSELPGLSKLEMMEAYAIARQEALINYYAKARVGVRNIANAIGFVALLWSTVVLLGGFVSVLTIKDFWFLSVLSLVMASKTVELLGANNDEIYVPENHILRLGKGLHGLEVSDVCIHWTNISIFSAVIVVKAILVMFIWSIYIISTSVSIALAVVRLVRRDYGDAGGDVANKAKLNAALIIFYVLVIFHGLSVFYWGFLNTAEPYMMVDKEFGFGDWGPRIVSRYRRETRVKCQKDGLLPNNWNLITFSVGLLESASWNDRLWGARVLDSSIMKGIPIRQELLSSIQAIQNLIHMIGMTREDYLESRERAARVMADLASELYITQFPDALGCMCCLLESCNQYSHPEVTHPSKSFEQILDKNACKVSVEITEHSHHQEDAHLSLAMTKQTDHKQVVNLASRKLPKRKSWIQTLRIRMSTTCKQMRDWERYFGDKYHYSYASKGTKELISQGLIILERLTQDQDNCSEIIQHQKLVSKITLPLSYQDLLSHGWDHTWAEMLSRSLTVVSRLIRAAPGEDTTRLHHDMSRNTVAIRNLMRILEVDCEGAFSELRGQAIEILTELAFVDSFRKLAFDESASMTEMFVKTLRRIFLEDRDGDAIVAKHDEDKDTTVRTKAGEALARLLRVPSARDNTDALISATNVDAVDLLPKQDVDVDDLLPKQDVIDLLTRVVGQILSSKAKKTANVATQAGATNNNCQVQSQPPSIPAIGQSSTQGNEEESESRKKLASILSLTVAICNNNAISADDFSRAIPDEVALLKKLMEIVETNMDITTDGWRILNVSCQLVIAMIQLKPGYIRELNEYNLKQALSKALETMLDIDNCMLFVGDDRQVPARSLASLVKEAKELLAQEQGDIIST